jgi:hypothetical protein
MRRALAGTTTVHMAADTAPADGTFDATVYPMALVAGKQRAPDHQRTRVSLDATGATVPQASLGEGPWIVAGDVVGRVAGRVHAAYPPLRDRWRCRLGVKTGADDVFLTREPDIEPDLIRPALRGRDIKPGTVSASRWIRWPCDAEGNALERLPPRAAAWFRAHRDRLRRRADYREGPPWALFRTRGAMAPHRVVWPDLAPRLEAAALTGAGHAALVPLNTCYVLTAPDGDTAILMAALLNSTWLRALACIRAPMAASGFRRFNAAVIEALPLPPEALDDTRLRQVASTDRSAYDIQALDQRLARLLGLTREEQDALAATVTAHRR